ncbi:preprotein translocase, SecA subunit, partial [human gut metagenome]
VYEDRKGQLDTNIYFPITDGHLGYNVPVNLQRCKDSDGEEIFKVFSKVVMFTTIDDAWREHLREMDDLRQSVQNATYEQKDPLLIYKLESFQLFSKMLNKVNADVLSTLNKAYIPVRENTAENVQRERQERAKVDVNKLQASRMQAAAQAGQAEKQKPMPVHVEKKDRPQRSLSLRQRQKIQELSRQRFITAKTDRRWVTRKRNNTSST